MANIKDTKENQNPQEQVEQTTVPGYLEDADALRDQLSKTEEFAKNNQNLIIGVVVAIVAIVGGIFLYNWRVSEQEQKAQSELFPAIFYLEKDSLQKAMKGDNATTEGLEVILDSYSSSKAAKLATFYAGVVKLKEGKFDEAINLLEDFNADDFLVQARAYSLIGDAYMEKDDLPQAIKFYKKASDHYPNDQFTPAYLFKLALAYELSNDLNAAAKCYKDVVDNFKEAVEKGMAEKNLARLEHQLKK